jgi:hypothetical protein
MLAELGFVGLFLFLTILALAMITCRRTRRLAKRGEVSKELGEFATAIESALVVFAIGGSFVIFQYVEMLWHTIGLSMAVRYLTLEELRAKQPARATPEPVHFVPAPLRATSRSRLPTS